MNEHQLFEELLQKLSDSELKRILQLKADSNQKLILLALEELKHRNYKEYTKLETKTAVLIPTKKEFTPTEREDQRLKQWNWAAFLLGGFWAYPNGLKKLGALSFVPVLNLYILFYLGRKGTELAWKHTTDLSLDEYLKLQKFWKKGAFRLFFVSFLLLLFWQLLF